MDSAQVATSKVVRVQFPDAAQLWLSTATQIERKSDRQNGLGQINGRPAQETEASGWTPYEPERMSIGEMPSSVTNEQRPNRQSRRGNMRPSTERASTIVLFGPTRPSNYWASASELRPLTLS